MLTILNHIDKSKYKLLIEYAYSRCDMFSLRVPAYLLEDCGSLHKAHKEFSEGIKQKLIIIEPYLIKKYTDNIYFCSIGEDCETYIVSLNKELKSFLLDAGSLYNWEYPQNRPEDLCLYSKQELWMGSIAHEEMCWIYPNSAAEKDILKNVIGLEFIDEEEDYFPPVLEL